MTVTPEDDDTYDREFVNIRYVVSGGDYDDLGGLQPVEVYDPRPGVSRGRLSSIGDFHVTLFRRNLIVEEGSEFIAAFRLRSVPKGNVTVRLVTEDYDVPGAASDKVTLSPETLTFTPENAFDWQEVTITAAEDDDYDHESVLIYYQAGGADYRGLLPDVLFVRVVDPPPAVHISQVGVLLREGVPCAFGVCGAMALPSSSSPSSWIPEGPRPSHTPPPSEARAPSGRTRPRGRTHG